MSSENGNENWKKDVRGISDPNVFNELGKIAGIPMPPNSTWRAATVVMFATNPLGVARAYLQYIQDLDWTVSEEKLLTQVAMLLQDRIGHLDQT